MSPTFRTKLTDSEEVFLLPRVDEPQRPVVQEQPVGRLGQKLDGDVALKAGLDGREPGVTLTTEAVFGLLALGAVKHGRTLASEGAKSTFYTFGHVHLFDVLSLNFPVANEHLHSPFFY